MGVGDVNDRRRLLNILAQNMALDHVRQPDLSLVRKILFCRDGKDLIQLLQSQLLRLPHEAVDHAPCDQVEASVESESTSGCHDCLHARECKTEDTSEGVVDAHGPSHALLTLDGGEDLGRVLESNGTLTQRVGDCEEVDEENDGADLSTGRRGIGLKHRQTSGQEEDTHEWESDETERATALCVNQEERRDREDDLDGTVTERRV